MVRREDLESRRPYQRDHVVLLLPNRCLPEKRIVFTDEQKLWTPNLGAIVFYFVRTTFIRNYQL